MGPAPSKNTNSKDPSTIWLGGSRRTRSSQRSRPKSRSKKGGETSYPAVLYDGKSKSRKRQKNGGQTPDFDMLTFIETNNPNKTIDFPTTTTTDTRGGKPTRSAQRTRSKSTTRSQSRSRQKYGGELHATGELQPPTFTSPPIPHTDFRNDPNHIWLGNAKKGGETSYPAALYGGKHTRYKSRNRKGGCGPKCQTNNLHYSRIITAAGRNLP